MLTDPPSEAQALKMNKFPWHNGAHPEVQFAWSECFPFWWMWYFLPGNVFLHSRQGNLLFKNSYTTPCLRNTQSPMVYIPKDWPLSPVPGHQSSKALACCAFQVGIFSRLYILPSTCLSSVPWDKQVVILRAVLMERTGWWMPAVTIGGCKTHRLPVVPSLQCFMTLLPAFFYLQCLYFCHWLTHQWQTWETKLTFPQLLSNFFWQIEPQSIRNVRHVLGYHSSWKFPETLV